MSSEPIFVIGSSRSGTSVLRNALGRHSTLFAPIEETNFVFDMWGNRAEISYLLGKGVAGIAEVLRRFAVVEIFREADTWGGIPVDRLAGELAARKPTGVQGLFTAMMEIASSHNGGAWVEKSPYHALAMDMLKNVFPGARFIVIVRDGREVTASQWKRDAVPLTLEHMIWVASEWKQSVNRVRRALRSNDRLSRDSILVRYEDLVQQPEQTLSALCAFVKIDFEPEMSSFSYSNSSFGDVETSQKSAEGIRKGASKWEAEIRDPAIVNAICWYLREELRAFGYEVENKPPGIKARVLCRRADARKSVRYDIKRFFAATGRSGSLRALLGMTERA